MVRARDDLCITVPSFFKCLIFLDIMKSPISLYTRFTYAPASYAGSTQAITPASPPCNSSKPKTLPSHLNRHRFENQLKLPLKFFLTKIEGFMDQLVHFLDNVDDRVIARTRVEFLEGVFIVLGFLVLKSIEDHEGLNNSILKGKKQSLDSLLLILQRRIFDSKIASAMVRNQNIHILIVGICTITLLDISLSTRSTLSAVPTQEELRSARKVTLSAKSGFPLSQTSSPSEIYRL
ncbi:U-box domain-containing protein 27 [Glycine soja]